MFKKSKRKQHLIQLKKSSAEITSLDENNKKEDWELLYTYKSSVEQSRAVERQISPKNKHPWSQWITEQRRQKQSQ